MPSDAGTKTRCASRHAPPRRRAYRWRNFGRDGRFAGFGEVPAMLLRLSVIGLIAAVGLFRLAGEAEAIAASF